MKRVAVGQVWTDVEEEIRHEYTVTDFFESYYSKNIFAAMDCNRRGVVTTHDMQIHESGRPVHNCWLLVYDPEEEDV